MQKTNVRKVVLKKLLDEYESMLCNEKLKCKSEYIGQVGDIIHESKLICGSSGNEHLYDVKFPDGQIWCCEKNQLRFI